MTYVHDMSTILEEKRDEIVAWMAKKRSEIEVPIYGSVDIRDAGWKIAVVDANQFPAGFNDATINDLAGGELASEGAGGNAGKELTSIL